MALDAANQDRGPRSLPVGVPPLTRELGLWGSWRTARRNVLELIPEAAFRLPMLSGGSRPGWVMAMDPPALERVMKDREPDYPKSAILIRLMKPRRGDNLITATGEEWRRQRRHVAPVFAARALEGTAPAITRAAADAADRLTARAGDTAVDVFPEMATTTCDVICDLVLSGREAVDRPALTRSVDAYIANVGRVALFDLLGVPNWVPRPGEIVDRSRARMDRMTDRIIAARRQRGPSDPPDLLDLLMAGDGDGAPNPLEVRNNLLGFLFAGHETTALSLTWALYLLALDPAAQAKARDEAQAALGDRAAGYDDLPRLGYVRQVLEEALRLYPPAGFLTRTALAEDTLSDIPVRPGMTVILPIYALHRHAMLWDEPTAFAPERFAPEESAARHRYAYLPFGGGPRICIGAGFALMEAQIILATLLARCAVSLPEGFAPRPQMWFTLRAGTGMPLRIARL